MLSLAEELLLLALEDEKGTVPGDVQTPLKYGLAAAGLVDLLLAGKLAVGAKNKVSVLDAASTGDEMRDEMLALLGRSKRDKSVIDWVRQIGNGGMKRVQERLEERLDARGILRLEEGRFLRLIPWHHYPTVDGSPEAETRERLRGALLAGEQPGDRDSALISLARACKLLDRLFPKEERKRVEARAKEIGQGNLAGQAVSRAVEEAMAEVAAMVAIMASTSATTSSS